MLPPSTENLTIPGGIKLFFDAGTGERDLGNIVDLDLDPKTEELKHYTNRSGKRRVDKVFPIEEELTMKFKLDEPVAENLAAYFKGGPTELMGAGTGQVTDQKVTLVSLILSSLGKYGLSAVTVRQFLDKCFRFDGAAYQDLSVEADTEAGTPFDALQDADDVLYLGKNTPFQEVYTDLAVNGAYTGLTWEYWNGSAWQTLAVSGAGANLDADGPITFTPPVDWVKTTVNAYTGYFIRVKATAVTTAATVNCFRQNLVQNVDYILDPGRAGVDGRLVGRVGRLAAGNIADGEEVMVSFTYTTWTALRFPIAAGNFVEGAARLECHPAEGRGLRFDIEIPKCQLKPNGALTLDDKKTLEVPMTLEVLDNYSATPDYPYGRVVMLNEV
ncbi:MAG: hypothetical protein C4567_03185 [Deltaproteobacteria bacterium]|nr:MAG: hypothetical protein C4567_03185 [Deltaproteobacteria bacterium]